MPDGAISEKSRCRENPKRLSFYADQLLFKGLFFLPADDLPDPLDNRAATAASPDDLLSQMADDAIDKLIAAADAGPPAGTAATDEAALPSEFNELLGDMPTAPAAPAREASLESVLAAAEANVAPSAPIEAPAAETPPHEPTANPETPPAAAPPASEPAIHSAADIPGTTADVKALLADDAGVSADKSSILLMPLEMLSTPLTHADDKIRNAVGQIAILTLLNAVAVLIYVFVVRGR